MSDDKCPLCGGDGKRLVLFKSIHTGREKVKVKICDCRVSSLVSEEYPLLSSLGDNYLPYERMDPQLVFKPADLRTSPNLLIRGDYDTLRYNIKSLIMRYRFEDPKPQFLFTRSISIMHDFFVPQSDGETPHLTYTNRFDLIIVCLGTMEHTEKLRTCLAQVVSMRAQDRRPTWLYLPEDRVGLEQCTYEYSDDLKKNASKYQEITLGVMAGKNGIKNTSVNKKAAENWGQ